DWSSDVCSSDLLGQHGRRGGAVAGDVRGLRGHLAHHLRAHVLELVLELDLLGDGDAVLGDRGGAEALLDDDVAALRTERHAHRVREPVDAGQDLGARVLLVTDLLGCHVTLRYSRMARTSSSRMMMCSSPSSLISVPAYLLNRILSPFLTEIGRAH